MTLYTHIARYVSITQLSFIICVKQKIILFVYVYISIYIGIWPLSLLLKDDDKRFFWKIRVSFFLLHLYKSSSTTTHLWRLMLRSCQQNLLPSIYYCSCNKCMQPANINNVSHSLRLLRLLYTRVVRLRIVSSYCAHIHIN
jgi:hypothetical protein